MSEFVGRATVDLAMQLFREGNISECINCVEKVVSSDPDNAKAYSILGAAYAQAGDKGMSIASFERSLALEPTARSHFNLGMAYEKCQRTREALEQYHFAVKCDPSYRQAADAMNRLSKSESSAPPATSGNVTGASVHLLSAQSSGTEPVVQEPPSPAPAPPQTAKSYEFQKTAPANPLYGPTIAPPKIDPNSVVDHGPRQVGNYSVAHEKPQAAETAPEVKPPSPGEFVKTTPANPLYGPTIAPPKIDPNSVVDHGPRQVGNYSVAHEKPQTEGTHEPAKPASTNGFQKTAPANPLYGPTIAPPKIDPNSVIDHGPSQVGNFTVAHDKPQSSDGSQGAAKPPATNGFQKTAPANPLYGPTIAPPKIDPNSVVDHGPSQVGNYTVKHDQDAESAPSGPTGDA